MVGPVSHVIPTAKHSLRNPAGNRQPAGAAKVSSHGKFFHVLSTGIVAAAGESVELAQHRNRRI
jgi:hypothetical protein